jgi:hypothetical protein
VTTLQILQHLNTIYGQITTHDLDLNMKKLHKEWSPANPIEDLFEHTVNNDPISEAMAVRSGVTDLEASGVFGDAIPDWRKRHEIEHTMVNFISVFKKADAKRQRQLTTKSAGYHHIAAETTTTSDINTTSNTSTALFYCWTHGAGPNANHKSHNCNMPAPGHRHEATLTNML